jgi:RNA polymerase sigma factor (sigma-70 family)
MEEHRTAGQGARVEELTTLVMRAREGAPEAFGEIVRRFQDMAVGYGYSILGDFHLAHDAAVEAFLEAYRDLSHLREPAAFPGWFRRIVFKQCDRIARGRRGRTVPLEEAAEMAAPEPGPAEAAEQRALQVEVRAAIAALPENERVATTLFYIGEYSQREIGAFLGVPVSTVKNRLLTARNRLRERMMTMVRDNLSDQRPSQSAAFTAMVVEMLRAAARGDGTKVRELLDRDAGLTGPHDDDEKGHPGITPLHYAAEAGQLEVARLLLDRGADPNVRDRSHGLTPLGWASVFPKQKREMAEFLLSRGAQADVFCASALGMDDELEQILAADASVANQKLSRSDCGARALHVAAWRGHLDAVQILLAHGADPRATDDAGKTPDMVAEKAGHAEVVAALRAKVGG